jgi:hypothetical protein
MEQISEATSYQLSITAVVAEMDVLPELSFLSYTQSG